MEPYRDTQHAYETIRAYFSKAGARLAVSPALAQSRYRTPDGRGCAVGCLIPDELYHPDIEGRTAFTLLCDYAGFDAIEALFANVKTEFLAEAQVAHDDKRSNKRTRAAEPWQQVASFLAELDDIALTYGLTIPAP